MAHSISLTEALAKFGQPAFAKFDIEGGEYSIFAEEPTSLAGSHLLIEWHKYKTEIPIPTFKNWETAQPFIDTEAYTTHYYSPKQSTSSDKA
jgi:hypothetical protein